MDQIKIDNWIKIVPIEKKTFSCRSQIFPADTPSRLEGKKKSGVCFRFFINDLIASNLLFYFMTQVDVFRVNSAPQSAEDYKNSRVKKQFASQIDSGECFFITERRIINHNLELNHRLESYRRRRHILHKFYFVGGKGRWRSFVIHHPAPFFGVFRLHSITKPEALQEKWDFLRIFVCESYEMWSFCSTFWNIFKRAEKTLPTPG